MLNKLAKSRITSPSAAMAATCNLPRPTFPKIPSFSLLPSRRFILPVLSCRKFPTFSTAAAVVSSGGPLEDLAATVMNPALVCANLLFFNSGYNVQILVEENEPEESLIRRFRREVSKAGIIQECKRRRFFENKKDELKRKKREASRRNRRRYRLGSQTFAVSLPITFFCKKRRKKKAVF